MSGPASSEAFAAKKERSAQNQRFAKTTFQSKTNGYIIPSVAKKLDFTPVTLPLIVVCNLFDASMVVVRVPRQEARVLLVRHEQADPHHQVDHNEDVVGVGQKVPGDRDALERKESSERFKGH